MADALASLGQGSSNANVAKIAIEQRRLSGNHCEAQWPTKWKLTFLFLRAQSHAVTCDEPKITEAQPLRKKKAEVVEPQIISEELLIEGVEEPVRPDGDAWEPIDFPQVTSLRLSFKNIIEAGRSM